MFCLLTQTQRMRKNEDILKSFGSKKGQIAVLIDPEKAQNEKRLIDLVKKADFAKIDYFFVGGSTVTPEQMKKTINAIKSKSKTPVVLFPGDYQQVNDQADGLLYLSLLSGRNPEYLIGQHVISASKVFQMKNVEVIPTAYLLVDGGKNSSVAYVSQTTPIPREKTSIATNTALAGILQGKRVVYFDSGSGSKHPVPFKMLSDLSRLNTQTPLIVGGGIRTIDTIEAFKNSGANVIVVGNHIEENIDFLLELNTYTNKKEE